MAQARVPQLGVLIHLVATGPRKAPSRESRPLTCSRPLQIWHDLQRRMVNPALDRSKVESISPDIQK
jgi:hypothetical protein